MYLDFQMECFASLLIISGFLLANQKFHFIEFKKNLTICIVLSCSICVITIGFMDIYTSIKFFCIFPGSIEKLGILTLAYFVP